MITELHTVTLYVTDQERAKHFYVDQLGLELQEDGEALGGIGRWIEVAPKGSETAFLLADASKWGKSDRVGNSADVTLRCTDVRSLYADLAAKGVPVTEPQTQRFGTFIDVTDPDGHRLRVVDLEGRTLPDRQGAKA
ncbi:MAG: VOC family protein [Nocardioidaceae bacterium]